MIHSAHTLKKQKVAPFQDHPFNKEGAPLENALQLIETAKPKLLRSGSSNFEKFTRSPTHSLLGGSRASRVLPAKPLERNSGSEGLRDRPNGAPASFGSDVAAVPATGDVEALFGDFTPRLRSIIEEQTEDYQRSRTKNLSLEPAPVSPP